MQKGSAAPPAPLPPMAIPAPAHARRRCMPAACGLVIFHTVRYTFDEMKRPLSILFRYMPEAVLRRTERCA